VQPPPFLEPKKDKEKTNLPEDCEVKRVPLNKHVPNKTITINSTLDDHEEQ
jgi:hypothetical protein